MRTEIKKEMEARIACLQERLIADKESNEQYVNAEIEKIKAEAQKESDRIDMELAGESTWNLYQSFVKAGFSEEQAWALVQICMSNATKRTLF